MADSLDPLSNAPEPRRAWGPNLTLLGGGWRAGWPGVIAIVEFLASIWLFGHSVVVGFAIPDGEPSDYELGRGELAGEAARVGVVALVVALVAVTCIMWAKRNPVRWPFGVGVLLVLCVVAEVARPKRHLTHVTSASLAADSAWAYPISREVAWTALLLGVILGGLMVRGVVRSAQPKGAKAAMIVLLLALTARSGQSLATATDKIVQARTWRSPGAADELRLLENDAIWREPSLQAAYGKRETFFSTATRTLSRFGVEQLTSRSFFVPGGRAQFGDLDAAARRNGWIAHQCSDDADTLWCTYEKAGISTGDTVQIETHVSVPQWKSEDTQRIEVTQTYRRDGDS